MTTPKARLVEPGRRVAVIGFGRTGQAVASVLSRRGVAVVVVDDSPDAAANAVAREAEVELVGAPDRGELARVVDASDLVVVSPGVAPTHPVFDIASSSRLVAEIELAYTMTTVPIVAVTGTNGKTTVVELVTAMLRASGLRAQASGNIGVPLVDVVTRDDVDVAVAEVSSFQLALTSTFRPVVATWLNFTDNHFDWHASRAEYLAAKSMIWRNQRPCDVAIANSDDRAVADAARGAPSRVVSFGSGAAEYRLVDDQMIGPNGDVLATSKDLSRDLPHDRLNALAALATAIEAGASVDASRSALASTRPPRHRIEYVATLGGVDYFDDSKATTPAAVSAALGGFASAVLIAGGRNKGLDLAEIRAAADRPDTAEVRAVVAIGEASDEVLAAFAPAYEVRRATSMEEAVELSASLARPGDAVLLSPGGASFDWYESYEARGDDFRRVVEAHAPDRVGDRSRR